MARISKGASWGSGARKYLCLESLVGYRVMGAGVIYIEDATTIGDKTHLKSRFMVSDLGAVIEPPLRFGLPKRG